MNNNTVDGARILLATSIVTAIFFVTLMLMVHAGIETPPIGAVRGHGLSLFLNSSEPAYVMFRASIVSGFLYFG